MIEAPPQKDLLSSRLPWILVAILGVAVVALIVDLLVYAVHFPGQIAADHSRWGEFGDFLGGTLNPFYSLLGLLALLLTIVLQNQELKHSARELKRSALAMEEQAAAITRQNFERTFFEMVRLHHDIVRAIDLRDDAKRVTTAGRDCFAVFYERFRKRHSDSNASHSAAGQLVIVIKAWDVFFQKHQHEIGHYFRHLHRILKFVDESDVERKTHYTGILRAQLSTYELALLFYNALHPVGTKLKPLVERYEMFENLDLAVLCNPSDEVVLFAKSAFGDQNLAKFSFPT